MKIIGEISHPTLKITVFKLNNRFSVKFEAGLYEQVYKFRTTPTLSSMADFKEIIDKTFIISVIKTFTNMHKVKISTLNKKNLDPNSEFENII